MTNVPTTPTLLNFTPRDLFSSNRLVLFQFSRHGRLKTPSAVITDDNKFNQRKILSGVGNGTLKHTEDTLLIRRVGVSKTQTYVLYETD